MNEGTPLGVKGTISHMASVPYTTPNCDLYLYLFLDTVHGSDEQHYREVYCAAIKGNYSKRK
jgi:hypothetical protein